MHFRRFVPRQGETGEKRRDYRAVARRIWQMAALPAAACLLVGVVAAVLQVDLMGTSSVAAPPQEAYILIDPGHGGADGGAQGLDGVLEKTINLAVSLPLRDMLWIFGYPVVLTREEDISIHSPDAGSLREQKVSDMKNRLAMYEKARLVVGIHQNQFMASQYYGTQVFYSVNRPESELLADAIRESVVTMVQPENKRQLKKATKDIYLLHKTTVPAVLVECGFLSNPEEMRKLKTEEYQQKMALAIAGGVLRYFS